ncbi:hypothetical protein ACFL6I_11875 [candidate division KSB1 bacterium]
MAHIIKRNIPYIPSQIEELARETGFVFENHFFDSKKYFVDSVWRVEKHACG